MFVLCLLHTLYIFSIFLVCNFVKEKKLFFLKKSQKSLISLQPKTWNLIGKPPYRLLIFIQECSFQWKYSSFVVGQHWRKVTFFKIIRLKLQKLLNTCWPSETENLLRWVICWKNFVGIAAHSNCRWNMVKSMRKSEFHPCEVFSTRALLRDGRYAKREFRAVQ